MKTEQKTLVLAALFIILSILIISCSDDNATDPGPPVPVITTTDVSAIMVGSAKSGGNITSNGGSPVIARGVCWSTNPIPKITDNFTSDGADTGSFTSSLNGLTCSTTYYVRAYATNSEGTGYGDVVSFTTLDTAYTLVADGRAYRAIPIGTQVWMAENLHVEHYRNGDPIANLVDDADWIGTYDSEEGGYCIWENTTHWMYLYGYLYNWYAVNSTKGLAPEGWHVPSDIEWNILINYLGGNSVAGGKLKQAGTFNWDEPNTGATNESGFTAIAAGFRKYENGDFASNGYVAVFWSSTSKDETNAFTRALFANREDVIRHDGDNKGHGFSVRLVMD